MFAKETYTTHRNSLKKRGDRFLAIWDNEESGDYADNTYHFRQGSTSLYFGTCPMPDWRYGYHIVWMGSSLPCVRKRRGWE